MYRGAFASAVRRIAWRRKNIFAAAVVGITVFGLASTASAETSGLPLIRIPPARLPPLAAAPPAIAAVTPGKIPPAARALLPNSVQVLRDLQGAGLAMYGALAADSAIGMVLAVFAHSQAFDPGPVLQLVLADKTDRHAQALFTATVHGAAVIGVAVAALSDSGGDITVFYDVADMFAASFPRMREALAASNGVGMTVLTPLRLADGGGIDVPPSWRLTAEGVGNVTLSGPQGEQMSLGATLPIYAGAAGAGGSRQLRGQCCDPVDAFAAIYPQLAAAGHSDAGAQEPGDILDSAPDAGATGDKSAFVLSNLRVGGEAYLYLAQAEAVAGLADPWTFKLSGVMAPQAIFATELPTLVRVWKSYSSVGSGFADKVERALQSINLTRDMLGATIAARQTAEYNAAPLWGEAIAGLAKTRDGEIDGELAISLAKRLSVETDRPWRVVPQSEWK